MRLEVLKQFPFAPDGQTVRMTNVGEVIDVPGDLVPGLLAARLIGEPRPQRETKVAEREPENADDEADEPAPQPKRRGRPPRENKDRAAPKRTSN